MKHRTQAEIQHIGGYYRRELTVAILKFVAAGTLVCVAITLPGLGLLFKYLDVDKASDKKRLARRVRYLEKAGYISHRRGAYHVTAKARQLLNEEEIWSLTIPHPDQWDGKWRVVLFDIPAKKQRARKALRLRLQSLGLEQYQESVYIHPFPIFDVVDKVAAFYRVKKCIAYMLVDEVDGGKQLKKKFSSLLQRSTGTR